MTRTFGVGPELLDVHMERLDTDGVPVHAYLYLPIKMAGKPAIRFPRELGWAEPVIATVDYLTALDDYIYLTSKRVWVQPGAPGNRPGWHGDGFGTDDLNYVWYDRDPTRFAIQDFYDIQPGHVQSMRQFAEQVDERNVRTYPNRTLLKLDQYVVHDVPTITTPGFRVFLKLSTSKHKYNLKGNSHNYEFDYDWKMYDRNEVRNSPIYGEGDFFPEFDEQSEERLRQIEDYETWLSDPSCYDSDLKKASARVELLERLSVMMDDPDLNLNRPRAEALRSRLIESLQEYRA